MIAESGKGARPRRARGHEPASATKLNIGSRDVEVSRLDKVFYPKTGLTKGGVIDYYVRVSEMLLPHLEGRPITLKRYPDGVEGGFFYEKRCPAYRPKWVATAPVWSEHHGEDIHYCVIGDLASLVWAVNLGDLEIHTFLARVEDMDRPTSIVFDLDPGAPADILHCARAAFWLREILTRFHLECFVKTSGSKGLQVYVPLNAPVTYAETKGFARRVAEEMTREHPESIVAKMEKRLRAGKVFVDWSQNDRHKTTVCVYSLRARERPTVSAPVDWREVKIATDKKDRERLTFDGDAVLKRAKARGDLFEPVLIMKQHLPSPVL